jgi:ribosomal protein S18 acetylase RimI-like enzyme
VDISTTINLEVKDQEKMLAKKLPDKVERLKEVKARDESMRRLFGYRTHKGKRGFKFDIIERERIVIPRKKKPAMRIFSAVRKDKDIGEIIYDPDVRLYPDDYNNKILKRGDGGILNVGVKNKFRNKGIGSELLKKIERIAKRDKRKRLVLEVDKNNYKAKKLYKRNGFKEIDGARKIKDGRKKKEFITMIKEL